MKNWYFDIKRIKQKNNHGCAIACVAAVCGVTYERARYEFFPKQIKFIDDDSLCVTAEQMIKVIDELGFEARGVDDFRVVKDRPVIIPLSWSSYTFTAGIHCIVYDPFKKCYIDPGPDQGNFTAKQYVELWQNFSFQSIVVTRKKRRS